MLSNVVVGGTCKDRQVGNPMDWRELLRHQLRGGGREEGNFENGRSDNSNSKIANLKLDWQPGGFV